MYLVIITCCFRFIVYRTSVHLICVFRTRLAYTHPRNDVRTTSCVGNTAKVWGNLSQPYKAFPTCDYVSGLPLARDIYIGLTVLIIKRLYSAKKVGETWACIYTQSDLQIVLWLCSVWFMDFPLLHVRVCTVQSYTSIIQTVLGRRIFSCVCI